MILLFLLFPGTLWARADTWVRVAEHDLAFARALANDRVAFGPEFREQVIAGKIWRCKPLPSKIARLSAPQVHQITRYCEDYCLPWNIAWSKAVAPCERPLFLPSWCQQGNEQDAAEHFHFGPYFETLRAAIRASDDPLMRHNVMAVIADRLDTNDLREFPLNVTEPWVTAAASAYLERATLDDAIAIGNLLDLTPFGPSPSLAGAFESFIGRSSSGTESQRSLAGKLLRSLRGEIIEEDETSTAPAVPETEHPVPVVEAPEVRTPERVALLAQRIDRYFSLNREGRYDESYALVASDYREKRDGVSAWIRHRRFMDSTGKVVGWQVLAIRIAGTTAKVTMDLRDNVKQGLFHRREVPRQDTAYWTFENDTWYNMVASPDDWRDDQSVAVPVPTRPPESDRGGSP